MKASFYYNEPQGRQRRGGFRVLNRLLIFGIIAAVCVLGRLLFYPLFKELQKQNEQIAKLESELAREQAHLNWQIREEELLKNDKDYIELVARDRLDMMKPGETIIRLEPKNAAGDKR